MRISLQKSVAQSKSQTLIVLLSQVTEKNSSKIKLSSLPPELNQLAQKALESDQFKGENKEALLYRQCGEKGLNLLLLGLGSKKELDSERLRSIGGVLCQQMKANKLESALVLTENWKPFGKDLSPFVRALSEGLQLANYSFDNLKSAAKKKNKELHIELEAPQNAAPQKAWDKALKEGEILADCTNFSRWLGDMPGNLMTPPILAQETQKKSKGTGLKVTVWDRARIKKEKMGGLLGVSLGSDIEPRFIVMEYKGAGAQKKPICFVGKALTFDTGGISIKPAQGMEEMKFDMCGGANVIGTMLAIARLKLKVNVIGLVPSSENMPGPLANKPGDILVARNGKTMEVNNTDAEGRLILSDALCYASEKKPQAIFDAATLTGAMVVALGNTHTGYFTRDQKLSGRIQKAADQSGEWVWPMPLTDYHTEDIKGTYADLSNIGATRGAGSCTAAAFLEQFVEKDIPWAHFDIAGTGWHTGQRLTYTSKKGASGVMVRTFVELAKSFTK